MNGVKYPQFFHRPVNNLFAHVLAGEKSRAGRRKRANSILFTIRVFPVKSFMTGEKVAKKRQKKAAKKPPSLKREGGTSADQRAMASLTVLAILPALRP